MNDDSNRQQLSLLKGDLQRVEMELRKLRDRAELIEMRIAAQERVVEAPPIIVPPPPIAQPAREAILARISVPKPEPAPVVVVQAPPPLIVEKPAPILHFAKAKLPPKTP